MSSLRIISDRLPVTGSYTPPGDSLISQISLLLGALSVGPTSLQGVVDNVDTVAVRRGLAPLGVAFTTDETGWLVVSKVSDELSGPGIPLNCGKSPSSLLLLAGFLAGQGLAAELVLEKPAPDGLAQILEVLSTWGCRAEQIVDGGSCRVTVHGDSLRIPDTCLEGLGPLAKSALLLAGLGAEGTAKFQEDMPLNDHTERALKRFGISLRKLGAVTSLKGGQRVHARKLAIPGDFGAAAFLMAIGSAVEGSFFCIESAGINPRRSGLVKCLSRMGVGIIRQKDWQNGNEPVANFECTAPVRLEPVSVAPNLAVSMIDEIPLLALAATQADGISNIRGQPGPVGLSQSYLEMAAMVLRQFGADIELQEGGYIVRGHSQLHPAEVQCAGNYCLAGLAVGAACMAKGESVIHGFDAEAEVFPGLFYELPAQIELIDS